MVQSSEILDQDVISWFKEMYTLNGISATYKRYEGETYDVDTGSAENYDDGVVDAVLAPIQSHQLMQDSRLQTDDRRLIFKQSGFPNNSDKGADSPTGNDKIVIDNESWTLDLNGETIYETDDTNTLYLIMLRKDISG